MPTGHVMAGGLHWDGAFRHPPVAFSQQSSGAWCSSQTQPQPQLRYQKKYFFVKILYNIHVCRDLNL